MNDQKVGTKDNIIDAAIYLFNSKGYEGTTVREIANKAKAVRSRVAIAAGRRVHADRAILAISGGADVLDRRCRNASNRSVAALRLDASLRRGSPACPSMTFRGGSSMIGWRAHGTPSAEPGSTGCCCSILYPFIG